MPNKKQNNGDNDDAKQTYHCEGDHIKIIEVPKTPYSASCYVISRYGILLGTPMKSKHHAQIIKAWLDSVRYDILPNGDPDFF